MKTVRNLVVGVVVAVMLVMAMPSQAYASNITKEQFCGVFYDWGASNAYDMLYEYDPWLFQYTSIGFQELLNLYYDTLGPEENPDYGFMWQLAYDWGSFIFNQHCSS